MRPLIFLISLELLAETHDFITTDDANRPSSESVSISRSSSPIEILTELFRIRPERARKVVENIQDGLASEDEWGIASDVAKLTSGLSKSQRERALSALNSLEQSGLVDRLTWGLEVTLDNMESTRQVEAHFKSIFSSVLRSEENRIKDFHEDLNTAIAGDDSVAARLRRTYGDKELLDYMVSQAEVGDGTVAAKIAKLLGWRDQKGVLYLDFQSSTSGKKDAWELGKTDGEIVKAIKALDEMPQKVIANSTIDNDRTHERSFKKLNGSGQVETFRPAVRAPEDERLCEASQTKKTLEVPALDEKQAPEAPFWFFRPYPDSDRIAWADRNSNHFTDMKTGKTREIPGPYDPVPTPDELFVTMPNWKPYDRENDSSRVQENGGISFFSQKALERDGVAARPFFTDKDLTGVYQSVGFLEGTDSERTYRVITDHDNGVAFRDYDITQKASGNPKVGPKCPCVSDSSESVCKPRCDQLKYLCQNMTLALPILSKDGQRLAALDIDTQTTKIFFVGEAGDQCKLEHDLGMFTGKVDFSYDNEKIAFSLFNKPMHLKKEDDGYIGRPSDSDDYVANVYVYDMRTKKSSRITDNTDSDSMYPAFRRDSDQLVYVNHPHSAKTGDGTASFVEVDLSEMNTRDIRSLLSANNKQHPAQAGLVALFLQMCSPAADQSTLEASVLATLNLEPERCKQLVEKYWDTFRIPIVNTLKKANNAAVSTDKLNALTRDQLAAACPKTPSNGGRAPVDERITQTLQTLNTLCTRCHVEKATRDPQAYGHLNFSYDNLEALRTQKASCVVDGRRQANCGTRSLAQEIYCRINQTSPDCSRMPPAGTAIDGETIDGINRYLAQ